jgi:hypothetical protein
MWGHHVVYESRFHSVITTLGGKLYRILEVVLTTAPPKQCRKVIFHTAKFILFTACSKYAQQTATTTTTSKPSIQQKTYCHRERGYYLFPYNGACTMPFKPRDNRLVEHIQPCQQQVCDSLSQAKQHKLSNKARSSPRFRFRKHFPLFPGNSTQWRPLLPWGGGGD